MAMPVDQAVAECREIMSATGSNQWSDAILKSWCGIAQWKLQADLLNINNVFYSQSVTVSQDSNGQFTVASLTTGSADAKKYFYRILSVALPATSGGVYQYFYRQSRYQDFPTPQPNTSLPYVWYRLGSQIQILPVSSGHSMAIQVNYRPPRVDALSGGSIAIDFPEGYEDLIPWYAASLALVKGGTETQAAKDIAAQTQVMTDNFLQDLGRQGTWPIVAQSFDTADMWGG